MKRRAIIIEPVPLPEPDDPVAPLWKRLAWFAGISLTAASVTAAVAYALRALPFGG